METSSFRSQRKGLILVVLHLRCYHSQLDLVWPSVTLIGKASIAGLDYFLAWCGVTVATVERRQLERFPLRIPLRFRPLGLAGDTSEHFTEAINISRGGFFFVTSAPLQVGMPIEATLNMPVEVTGNKADETHCRARLVHAKADSYSDGRMGYGAEIEMFLEPKRNEAPTGPTVKAQPARTPAKS